MAPSMCRPRRALDAPLDLDDRVLDEQVAVLSRTPWARRGTRCRRPRPPGGTRATRRRSCSTCFCGLAMMPPVQVTRRRRRRRGALTGTSISSRSWSRRPCSGCAETYRPSASFSRLEQRGLVELGLRHRGTADAPLSSARRRAPKRSPWPFAASLRWRSPVGHGQRAAPRACRGAGRRCCRTRRRLMSASSARLLATCDVDAGAEVEDRREAARRRARGDDGLDGADADALHGVQAEADLAARPR